MSNKELEKKESTELATPADLFGGSTGFEGTTAETFVIPMMKVVQALSPVVTQGEAEYNESAKPGMFYNPATGELFKEMDIRILGISHDLVAWKPDRGGFAGSYHISKEKEVVAKQEGYQKWDKDGNELMSTITFTCVMAGNVSPEGLFFFPLSSSSLKYGKALTSRLFSAKFDPKTLKPSKDGVGNGKAKTFIGKWNVSTVMEKNDKGSWFTIGKTPKLVDGITMDEAKQIVELSKILDTAKLDHDSMQEENKTSSTEDVSVGANGF